ncbi:MAG: PilZ domain-containing protein [Hyphomicrobiaceae bacterium]
MTKIIPFGTVGSAALKTEPEEPRLTARRRILKGGMVCFNDRHSTLPCAVRDLSEQGARLRLSGSVDAPDTFELFIELDGVWVDCDVIWRSNDEIGVAFSSPKRQEAPTRKQVLQQQQVAVNKPSLRRKPVRK